MMPEIRRPDATVIMRTDLNQRRFAVVEFAGCLVPLSLGDFRMRTESPPSPPAIRGEGRGEPMKTK